MNQEQKQHLLNCLEQGKRYDGRGLLEWRSVTVEQGISANAEGSARVFFGKTQVMAGVKLALEKPYEDTPDSGNLMVNAELYPLSSPFFEPGPPPEQGIEMARVIDRGIRESHSIDTHKLCLKAGEKVWSVSIDIVSINDAGNLLDAGSFAALAALKQSKFPKATDDGVIDYAVKTKESLPVDKDPVEITVYKIGNHLLVDLLPEEEEAADARLTVATTKNNTVCALQKGGPAPFTIEEVDTIVGIAIEKASDLRKLLK